MYANELLEWLLRPKIPTEPLDEAAAFEAGSLVSGSFVGELHRALWLEGLPMQAATERLESLYDQGEYHAVLYLVALMASAVELDLPGALGGIASNEVAVPVLAAAMVEDWVEMDAMYDDGETE